MVDLQHVPLHPGHGGPSIWRLGNADAILRSVGCQHETSPAMQRKRHVCGWKSRHRQGHTRAACDSSCLVGRWASGGTPMSKLERPVYRSRSVDRLISKGTGSLGRAVAPRGDLGLISSGPIENQLKPRFTVICLDPYSLGKLRKYNEQALGRAWVALQVKLWGRI